MNRGRWLVFGCAGVLAAGWFGYRATRPPVVEVVQVQAQAVSTTLALTGRVEAVDRSSVSAPAFARVTRVLADVGDEVVPGQLLVELDTRDLSAAVQAAQAAVEASRAELEQARTAELGSEATLQVTALKVEESFPLLSERDRIQSMVNRLEQDRIRAAAALRRVETGDRPESIRAAEAEVRAARAALQARQADQTRTARLYEQGAVALSQVEAASAMLAEAKGRLESAEQRLAALSRGREEDVAQAQATLHAIEAELSGARQNLATAQASLETRTAGKQELSISRASRDTNRAAVRTQEARLSAALAQLRLAQSRLEQSSVVAPFAGKITARMVEPGLTASPGQVLFELTAPERLRIRLDVDEALLHEVSIGQQAVVTAPAVSTKMLAGEVTEISRAADPTRGTVEVRVRLLENDSRLLAQMTVDVNLVVANYESVLVIPRQAATGDPANSTVMVVENNRLARKPVKIARADRANWVVLEGLQEGDLVVIDPETAPQETHVETRVVPLTKP